MSSIHDALERIHALVDKKRGIHILHTSEVARLDRELLMKAGWLEEIIQGWYLVVRPDTVRGESTVWYANFWDFASAYLQHHYGQEYCLSAESSLDLQLGNCTVPKQVVVIASGGSGKPVRLPHDTSLLVYSHASQLPEETEIVQNLRVMPLVYALCKVTPSYFALNSREAQIALQSITDPTDLIRFIVKYNFKAAAGRVIAAYRHLENMVMADHMERDLRTAGIVITETNPFLITQGDLSGEGFSSPFVARIYAMWKAYREVIIDELPLVGREVQSPAAYLNHVTELYAQDAYHSLSIEGYQVTQQLVEKVKNAKWNPDGNLEDRQQRNTLAARGYYEAFTEVKKTIQEIFEGLDPGMAIERHLQTWFQKLFNPSVQLGIIQATELYGYRRSQVYIRNSRHTPPPKERVKEMMMAFFDCMKKERNAAVRAILGHFIFVYIHPYMDGNGRLGRFVMNTMLASGGYPWTIIHVERRDEYIDALEAASVGGDIRPFVQFVRNEMTRGH